MVASSFPSLTIRASQFVPQGAFAEAQAAFLAPDPAVVAQLVEQCARTDTGIVAHFYMDAELQGALVAAGPETAFIADSLAMSDAAVTMARAGKRRIVVLGVDFMSENVRAVLDAAGFANVDVYRLSADPIGCSLAESAESSRYTDWLGAKAKRPATLHVVYINTSLLTKAKTHAILPTITCTSSNVVQTLLQAKAQMPEVAIAYGPDTYMGGNLAAMLAQYAALDDATIRALHPAHNQASIASLLEDFDYYRQGTCIVHHLFGDDVVERVKAEHPDALLTAHLEVPGEMFALAAAAQRQGRGVVGSTSNILAFINAAVKVAVERPGPQYVPVVLGTEAGMITSIVSQVRKTLIAKGRDDVDVEIVFPVASEAVAQAPGSDFGIVPGVAGGDGCSVAGGCATCPYMKMNSMSALLAVLGWIEAGKALDPFRPRVYSEVIDGRTATEVGSEPILHMRHFQQTGQLPDVLVADVRSRHG